jgi:hypothetical protein
LRALVPQALGAGWIGVRVEGRHSFAPAFGKWCFEQPLPAPRRDAVKTQKPRPRNQAGSSWLFSRVRSFGPIASRALDLDPRFRAADQLGNIPACRMITFTFRDRSIALKETFDATFDPPDAKITLG